jgi:hypothetical protein
MLHQETVILKIELLNAPYPINRTIQVPANISLSQLHELLQTVFEWKNIHFYCFYIDKKEYSSGEEDGEPLDPNDKDATENVKLKDILKAKQFEYVYDFGDG